MDTKSRCLNSSSIGMYGELMLHPPLKYGAVCYTLHQSMVSVSPINTFEILKLYDPCLLCAKIQAIKPQITHSCNTIAGSYISCNVLFTK
jgi:hypothetical protein